MNLTDDEILKCQAGEPIFFEDICAVYPATNREIIRLGYSKFQQYLSIILFEKPALVNDAEELAILNQLSDFQYLLIMTTLDGKMNQLVKDAFYFFTHETVSFSLDPAQIVFGPLEEKHILNEEKFYELRTLIRRMYFIEVEGEPIVIYATDSPATRKLKEKMRANREQLRKAKAKKSQQEKTDLQFSDLIGSICINNCGLNMSNIYDITNYALHDQLKRMGWRDQFDINQRAALAGAKIHKSQLKHWMRSIASSDKS